MPFIGTEGLGLVIFLFMSTKRVLVLGDVAWLCSLLVPSIRGGGGGEEKQHSMEWRAAGQRVGKEL